MVAASPPPGGGNGKSPASIPSPNRQTQRPTAETALSRYQMCHDMLNHALSLPENDPKRASEIARYIKALQQREREEPMTLDILVATKIGRVVHKLRKDYPEANVLRDRWLKLMPESAVSQQTKQKWENEKQVPKETPPSVAAAGPTPLLVKVSNGTVGGSSTVLLPKTGTEGANAFDTVPEREIPMPPELMVCPTDDQEELHRKLIVATLFQAGPRAAMMQSILEKKLELRPGTLRKPLHDAALTGHFLFNSSTKTWELTTTYFKHLRKQSQQDQEESRKRKCHFPDGKGARVSPVNSEEDQDPVLREVFVKLIAAMPTPQLQSVSARVMRRHAEKEMGLPELSLDSRKNGIAAIGVRLVQEELRRRAQQQPQQQPQPQQQAQGA